MIICYPLTLPTTVDNVILFNVNPVEVKITGTLPPTGNLKPNLKASPSLLTHAMSEVNPKRIFYDYFKRTTRHKHACFNPRHVINMGTLSEGSYIHFTVETSSKIK
jgi:hypothetical protein